MRDRIVDWHPADKGRKPANPALRRGRLPTVLVSFLMPMLLGAVIGCGGSDPPTSTPAARPAPPPPPPTPPSPTATEPSDGTEPGDPPQEGTPSEESEPVGANPPEEGDPEEGSSEGGDTEQDTPPDGEPSDTDESSQPTDGTDTAEEMPTRPEEITEWKTDDYMTALAEDDPKLVEAVEHLGRQFVGTPSAAGLLVRLIKPPQPAQPAEDTEAGSQPGYLPPSHQGGSKLNEAIIGALGINNTDESRRMLAQLLIGKIPTDDEMVTVGLVLGALTEHRGPENEAILLRVLTEAEKLRPQTDGPVTAESLRQQAFEAVKPTASERLRVELAKHLLQPTTPGPQQAMLRPWLEENKPENLGAQMLLYAHDGTPKAVLENVFTQAASTAMGLALRVSTGAAGTSGVATPGGNTATGSGAPDLDAPYRAVGPIWSPAGVALIEGRLAQLESLETQASLVMLAAAVPVDSTRAALWQTLDTHWDDGPAGLISAGLLTQIISDPGILLSLKSAARKQASRRVVGREALEKFQETRTAWVELANDAVKIWCERLHEAALAEAKTAPVEGQPPAGEAAPVDLPITLHKDARVSLQYRSNWPSDVQAKLPGVALGPMEVRYVRIEEKARLLTTKGFYKRRLNPSEKDLHETDESVWMERFRIVPGTDRKCSIDLIITRADGPATEEEADREADDTENLIIEILTIEMKDPEPA